mgnify:CR=1 FL=1
MPGGSGASGSTAASTRGAVALGLIAGFLDMIPNIGATIAGFILSLTLLAEEGAGVSR